MVAASAFILGLSFYPTEGNAIVKSVGNDAVAVCDNIGKYVSRRPEKKERLFISDIVEKKIAEVKEMLTNPYLAWMFENCFPIHWILQYIIVNWTVKTIRLFIPVISTPCGCAIREPKYGLMSSWLILMQNLKKCFVE